MLKELRKLLVYTAVVMINKRLLVLKGDIETEQHNLLLSAYPIRVCRPANGNPPRAPRFIEALNPTTKMVTLNLSPTQASQTHDSTQTSITK